MRSPTRILDVEPPQRIRSRFGNAVLRGETEAMFEPEGDGTSLTQRFRTEGLIPAIAARTFATGSWRGSFRGELSTFAKLAERDAANHSPSGTPPIDP
jgi:type II secretory pathway component PulF